ncbi:predicted protein [Histoplasma capsulatum var. duboisii H88]|uniref:Predicted protein n=1 Tax=Ajellomyces capsulatus (strain H88) TaxID=544711 RepID=F0UVA0_AJEC8|nr:predicted protein [Histoplasma capsulatum var. duboisii H88]
MRYVKDMRPMRFTGSKRRLFFKGWRVSETCQGKSARLLIKAPINGQSEAPIGHLYSIASISLAMDLTYIHIPWIYVDAAAWHPWRTLNVGQNCIRVLFKAEK